MTLDQRHSDYYFTVVQLHDTYDSHSWCSNCQPSDVERAAGPVPDLGRFIYDLTDPF